jgi:hypothetical protein
VEQVAQVDNDQIRVRCSHTTKIEFKKVVAEFKDQEEAILAFIKAYKQYPWVFKEVAAAKASIK